MVRDGCCTQLEIVEVEPSRLALVGELDIDSVPEVEARLARCDGDVVVDCSGLTFVDASGLGLFVRALNACEARGVKFTLAEPAPRVVRLLSITGLDTVFLTGPEGSG